MDEAREQLVLPQPRRIWADAEFIELLEELRKDIEKLSYGALNSNLSYTHLTKVLTKKIKIAGGLKKLRGTV